MVGSAVQSTMQIDEGGPELFVGTAGWSYDDWKGTVYPKPAPKGFRGLSYLARFFNTVELNNTFYRPPRADYCRRWVQDVEGRPDFRFTAKLWQRFTHERQTPWTRGDVGVYRDALAPISEAGKLGALLVQFPWSFRDTDRNRDWLRGVVDEFRDMTPVVEFRHAEWVRDEPLRFLESLDAGFCNIDQPHMRSNIPLTALAFGRVGYMRLHGRNYEHWFADNAGSHERYDYLYGEDELDEIERAVRDIAARVEQLYVVANNHYRGQAPANALQLMRRLTGADVEIPETLAYHYDLS